MHHHPGAPRRSSPCCTRVGHVPISHLPHCRLCTPLTESRCVELAPGPRATTILLAAMQKFKILGENFTVQSFFRLCSCRSTSEFSLAPLSQPLYLLFVSINSLYTEQTVKSPSSHNATSKVRLGHMTNRDLPSNLNIHPLHIHL